MGNFTVVHYQRTTLFRTFSANIQARPRDWAGKPYPLLAAFCLAYTGLDALSPQWVRDPADWQPPATGLTKELVRHFIDFTLVRYPTPEFMYRAWETGNRLHQQWFIHLAAGFNIRKAGGLPWGTTMTKRHAHYFTQAPAWMTIDQALRFGKCICEGGTLKHAKAFATALDWGAIEPDNESFWLKVLRLILKHPALTESQIRAALRQWNELFFEKKFETTASGRLKQYKAPSELHPEQENAMKAMLQLLAPKPEQIGGTRNPGESDSNGLLPACPKKWRHKVKSVRELKNWEVQQLDTAQELINEGLLMQHCVGGYVAQCQKRRAYIFQIFDTRYQQLQFHVTVEVSRYGQIRQVRGPMNRLPNEAEVKAVRAWAKLAGINADCWELNREM